MPLLLSLVLGVAIAAASDPTPTITAGPLTHGPQHHFYGYIGQAGNTPWNGGDRYLVLLRTAFQDHMPAAGEAAEIVLLDRESGDRVEAVESTRAWNFQQGTMLYWNPELPDRQFFFNDRDPVTQEVFCVLYDVTERRRIREYRFGGSGVGNSGVAQPGGFFFALNYGRLARLRPVTGYPGTKDWSEGHPQPDDDGVWKVDVSTGKRVLLVSYRQLAQALQASRPDIGDYPLFINHTLCSRDGTLLYGFLRGGWEGDPRPKRVDAPFLVHLATGNLKIPLPHTGGHPEWAPGNRLIGSKDQRQVLFDPETGTVVGTLGTPESLPTPGGDVALSPDGQWLINGRRTGTQNRYTVLHMDGSQVLFTHGLEIGKYREGELRIDPAPCWNRAQTAFTAPGLDTDGTRQLFLFALGTACRAR